MATIPPWLNIDPVAPVGRLLEGYRAGLSASEAQNAAARAAQAQAQQAQQMALAQAQAEQLNAYRQQQQAIQLEQLRMEQSKAEREASNAALQLGAQRKVKEFIASGGTWPQALAQFGPDLFAGKPDDLARAMQIITPPRKPIFSKTPEGILFGQDAQGNISYPPVGLTRPPFTPQVKTFGEGEDAVKAIETSPGHWQTVRGTKDDLTKADQFQLRSLERKLEEQQKIITPHAASVAKVMKMSAEELKKKPEFADVRTAIDKAKEYQEEIDTILGKSKGKKKKEFSKDEILKDANEKITKIMQNLPEGPSRQSAINQVIAVLRAQGINVTDPTQPPTPTAQPAGTGSSYGSIRGF